MSYVIVFKTIDGPETDADTETNNKDHAIERANQFVCGGEGIVEYAYITDGVTNLEFSYSTCEWEAA